MKIAVFCGSNLGRDDVFRQQAVGLGQALGQAGHQLVYGGGQSGLMGAVADAVLASGSRAIGVIPSHLHHRELAHTGLTQLFVVKDMHERKAKMADLADAFIAMPGGVGTMEEIFEVWAWAHLGYHNKPCAFFNVAGYYDGLLRFIDTMVEKDFVKIEQHQHLTISDNVQTLLINIADRLQPEKTRQSSLIN